jgi:hypothetical protein
MGQSVCGSRNNPTTAVPYMAFAMLDSDMFPSNGELIELTQRQRTVQRAWCSLCGTEFTYQPDSTWVLSCCHG